MSSTPDLRNGNTPSRPPYPTNLPNLHFVEAGVHFRIREAAQLQSVRLIVLSPQFEPSQPLSAINDDPLFNTGAAATILAVSYEQFRKWRQRNQGPGQDGSVGYALSTLTAFKLAQLLVIRNKNGGAVVMDRCSAFSKSVRVSQLARFHRAGAL